VIFTVENLHMNSEQSCQIRKEKQIHHWYK